MLQIVNQGLAVVKQQPSYNGMSSRNSIEMLLTVFAVSHFANESCIPVSSIVVA
jgi:hypothetical protein